MFEEGRWKRGALLPVAVFACVVFAAIIAENSRDWRWESKRNEQRKAWGEGELDKKQPIVTNATGAPGNPSGESETSNETSLLRDKPDTEGDPRDINQTDCRWRKYSTFESELRRFLWGETPEPRSFPRKLLFVKTPKTGGSTVATVLAKYAKHRNLTILPPPLPSAVFENETAIKNSMTEYGIEKIDGFVSHSIYYKELFERYLETTSPFRLTIVREHFSRVWSAYFYAHGFHGSENRAFCSKFASDPITWASNCSFVSKYQLDYVAPQEWEPENRTVDRIFDEFDHIFVTERMTESLLALIPKLNLTMDELLSVNLKSSQQHDITPAQEQEFDEIVHSRSEPDMIAKGNEFYLKANDKLDADLAKLPRFALEAVEDLVQMQVELTEYCDGPGRNLFKLDCLYPGVGCQDECIRSWVAAQVYCNPESNMAG